MIKLNKLLENVFVVKPHKLVRIKILLRQKYECNFTRAKLLSSRRHGIVILFVYRRFRQAVSVLNQYVSSSRQRANRRRHGEINLSDFPIHRFLYLHFKTSMNLSKYV